MSLRIPTRTPWIHKGVRAKGSRWPSIWTANGDIQIATCCSPSLSWDGNLINAEFIARACTAHAPLVEALERLVQWHDQITKSDIECARNALALAGPLTLTNAELDGVTGGVR